MGPPRLEDKPWGEERQHKTPLNLRHLITQISSGVDVSCDEVARLSVSRVQYSCER